MGIPLYFRKCVPCEGKIAPLELSQISEYLSELTGRWEKIASMADGKIKKIRSRFEFKNFKEAMLFINKVAAIAEEEGHHPDILISYNKVMIELWTHAIQGLSENDFILASKIEKVV